MDINKHKLKPDERGNLMLVKVWIAKAIVIRHSLARKLGKPIVMLESISHGGYCFIVWSEGHELLSLCAAGMLVCILTSIVLGAE
jgi:hypothetical protein